MDRWQRQLGVRKSNRGIAYCLVSVLVLLNRRCLLLIFIVGHGGQRFYVGVHLLIGAIGVTCDLLPL
jgi:hypothetical protein